MSGYFDLTGKVALITGGSRGLGLAMAKAYAEHGADVIISSRNEDSCRSAVAEIEAQGGKAYAIAGHVGKWDGLEELVDRAYTVAGNIDILVNNAGIAPVVERSLDVTESLFDKTLDVNLKGPFRLSALIGSRMVENGKGVIINVTSTGAINPEPEFSVYASAKGALNIITKAHALEYGPNVRVNAIMAGPFWTDISKSWREEFDKNIDSAAGRIGRAHEVVTTALYLASDHSSYTTGAVLTVDGGQR